MSGEPWRRTQDVLLGRLLVQGGYLGRPAVAAALDEASSRVQAGAPSSLAAIILESGQLQSAVLEHVFAEVRRAWAVCSACGAANARLADGQSPGSCQQCKDSLVEPGEVLADPQADTMMISPVNQGPPVAPPASATAWPEQASGLQASVAPVGTRPASASGFLPGQQGSHVLLGTPGSGSAIAPPESSTMLHAIPKEGTEAAASGEGVAFDKYVILSELGRGGMGIVYKAWHPTLRRTYALKVLLAGEDASPEAIARFQNEAAAVARMGKHPNIVSIHETGQVGNRCFFTLDFVDGPSLEALVQERSGNLPVRQVAEIMGKVARAVHHAHRNGVIHRDLKPQNILIDSKGEPHVTDFGLAKDVQGESGITRTGVAMGSPPYMSPEQASGRQKAVDERSDVYSLGSTLYFALTGRAAFGGSSVLAVITKVMTADPESPRKHRMTVPAEMEAICLRAMEKDPESRYQSAKALAEDMSRWLKGKSVEARPPTRFEIMRRWLRRHTVSMAVAMVAVVVCAGAVAWTVSSQLASSRELEQARNDSERRKKVTDLVAQARRLPVTAQDEGRRLEILSEALALIPEDLEALAERGMAYQRTGQIDEAMADLQELTRLSPDDLEARYDLGELLAVHKGRLEQVRRMALTLRNQYRTSPLGPLLEALVCLEEGDEKQARSSLALAAANDGESWWQFHLIAGRLALVPGPSHDAQVAEAAFDLALVRRKTRSAQLYALRALAREELNDVSGALSDCKAALELTSTNALALAVRGYLKASAGDREGGYDDVERAFDLDSTALEVLYYRGRVHLAREETAPALEYLEAALSRSSRDARVLFSLGQAYEQAGDLPLAIEKMEQAMRLAPRKSAWKKVLEQTRRRTDPVVEPRVPVLTPPPVEEPSTRGERVVAQSDLDMESQQRVEQVEPLLRAQRYQEVLTLMNAVLRKAPGYSWGYLLRGQALDGLRRSDDALKDFARCRELSPEFTEPVLCASGKARLQNGDLRGALQDFEQLALRFPAHNDSYYYLGVIREQMGDLTAAIAAMDQAIGRDPEYHLALEQRGQIHLKLGNVELAITDLWAARRSHMSCSISCRLLAVAQMKGGDREAALKTLADLVQLDPSARGWLAEAPDFAEIRADPRFQKMLEVR